MFTPVIALPGRPRPTHVPRPRRALAQVAASLVILVALSAAPAAARQSAAPAAGPASPTLDATTRLEGIDVSHWQGAISWPKVAAAGKKFAIIKATDGLVTDGQMFVDDKYAYNHANAKAAGLWTGAYHFARPDATAGDAVREADHFVSVMNLSAGDLIPALDLEQAGGLTIPALQAWVKAFLDEVTKKIGAKPMIYTSPAFWKKYMGDSQALADLGYKTLWVAHWGVSSPTVPANNWGGKGWTFWQYTSSGTVSGISTKVDLDRFNGADLGVVAYSAFKLTASAASVKQGAGGASTVSIIRTNFSSGVDLSVSGLPAGSTASFDHDPATGSSTILRVTTPSDPTATPTGTYRLTITGEGGGITRTATANLTVTDGTPPTVGAPYTAILSGKQLGTSTIPVRISWAATDPSGIASSTLQRSTNGGAFATTTLPSPTVTSVDMSQPMTSSVQQRVRATDKKSNASGYVTGPVVINRISQQTSAGITYTGSWTTQTTSSASGGSTRYSTGYGATATFRFTGSNVGWVSGKGPTRGSAKIYVDGVYVKTISLYATTNTSRNVVFSRNWGAVGSHALAIVVVATPGHARVDVDAFVKLTLSSS